MIQIQSLTIKEFRGIRDLTLDFAGKNFAVCGPNGTGKSGVVDALEFVLTGNISRLSGEGRGEISLEEHGPHVDSRSNPAKARVSATVTIPSCKKTVTIERSVKTPGLLQITPSSPEVVPVLKQLEAHPEVVLSRRELIRYVLATPGKRAEEVQALLHLDQVEQVRLGLQKIANSCERQLPSLTRDVTRARDALLAAFDITAATREQILTATNARRAILGLPALSELMAKSVLKDGMATITSKPQRFVKTQGVADLKAARDALYALSLAEVPKRLKEVRAVITELSEDPNIKAGITKQNFYKVGLQLIQEAACPFCDTQWDLEELKALILRKLDLLKKATEKRAALEKKIEILVEPLELIIGALDALARHGAQASPAMKMPATRAYRQNIAKRLGTLSELLPFSDSLAALKDFLVVPKDVTDEIAELKKYVTELPEPSKDQTAREWLTIAQEKFEVYNGERTKERAAKDEAVRARNVSAIYVRVSDKILSGIYVDVEKQFSSFYRFINSDDESSFEARLEPSMGKLGFNVDFYGRGFFPPGAYHSEGHQDSMGLCLYLALMKHLHGDNFTFAVLDDVLMSVDISHRREVCALLRKHFPNTQFVMTTHDPIWLRHMRTENLITARGGMTFRSWDIARGPTLFDDRDVWQEIEDHLEANDVRTAAGALRNYLEYVAAELCHYLRAPVEYRGDAHYQLGELLPPAIGRLRKLYASGKEAANSWNQKDVVARIAERADTFSALVAASNAEQWQVNIAIHYNSWENLSKKDFQPVAAAFKALLGGFSCSDCHDYLAVSPDRETPESLRCGCGKVNINLKRKP